ncbi:MAG: hypothetical protein V3Q69_11020 [Burkholderia sp.]
MEQRPARPWVVRKSLAIANHEARHCSTGEGLSGLSALNSLPTQRKNLKEFHFFRSVLLISSSSTVWHGSWISKAKALTSTAYRNLLIKNS